VIWQVAIDTPLRRVFDYLPPADFANSLQAPAPAPERGVRVRVPFGRRQLVGILVGTSEASAIAQPKLKSALEILDSRAVFDPVTFELLCWAAEYYHHPVGEVMAAALPVSLRSGQPAEYIPESWTLTETGRQRLSDPAGRRAPGDRGRGRRGRRERVQAGALQGPRQARLDRRPARTRRTTGF